MEVECGDLIRSTESAFYRQHERGQEKTNIVESHSSSKRIGEDNMYIGARG
jgi:hypothetical protein